MSKLDASTVVIAPSTWDSSNKTVSPSLKLISFWGIKVIWELVTDSATYPHALLVTPLTFSPITKSAVFPVGPVRDVNVKVGADGSEVDADS